MIEDGKMRFLEGTLSFNAGFSSVLPVKNYEFWLKNEAPRYFMGKSFDTFSGDPYHQARKQLVWENSSLCPSTYFLSRIYSKD